MWLIGTDAFSLIIASIIHRIFTVQRRFQPLNGPLCPFSFNSPLICHLWAFWDHPRSWSPLNDAQEWRRRIISVPDADLP